MEIVVGFSVIIVQGFGNRFSKVFKLIRNIYMRIVHIVR
jgi:hypothetical protein